MQEEKLNNMELSKLTPFHGEKDFPSNHHKRLPLAGYHQLHLKRMERFPDHARGYEQGDSIKNIDWNVFARSDQLVVRERFEKTNAKISIGLDISQSMFWPDKNIADNFPLPQKIEVATRIFLNLAYRHLSQNNQVNLWLISTGSSLYYQPKTKDEIVYLYAKAEKNSFTKNTLTAFFHKKKYFPQENNTFYWISDGIANLHNYFLGKSPHSLFLHILSTLEQDFSWVQDNTSYFGEKFGNNEIIGSKLKRKDYFSDEVTKWLNNIRNNLKKNSIHHVLLTEKSLIKSYMKSLYAFK